MIQISHVIAIWISWYLHLQYFYNVDISCSRSLYSRKTIMPMESPHKHSKPDVCVSVYVCVWELQVLVLMMIISVAGVCSECSFEGRRHPGYWRRCVCIQRASVPYTERKVSVVFLKHPWCNNTHLLPDRFISCWFIKKMSFVIYSSSYQFKPRRLLNTKKDATFFNYSEWYFSIPIV